MQANFEQRREALVNLIYDAVLDTSLWSRVLENVADLVGGSAGLIHGYAVDRETYTFHDLGRVDPDCKRRHELYHIVNPLTRSRLFPPGHLVRSDDMMPLAQLKRTSFYADVLRPQNIAHCMIVALHRRPDLEVSINIERSETAGPFNETEMQCLASLVPHLRRASELRLRMMDYRSAAQAERDALDALATGVVTFDTGGRIILTNEAARSFASELGIRLTAGREIEITSNLLTRRIHALVGDAVRGGAGGTVNAVRNDRTDTSVTIVPVRGLAAEFPACSTARPAATMLMTDMSRQRDAANAMLAMTHNLTPAELRVAAALALGEAMSATAENLGITLNTLKTHAKRVYAKAGVRGQADLIRLMAQLAPPLRASA